MGENPAPQLGRFVSRIFATKCLMPIRQGRFEGSRSRLLFVISTLALGGTEKHLSLIAPALVKRGYTITVYNVSGIGNLHVQKPMVEAGVNITSAPLRSGRDRNKFSSMIQLTQAAAKLMRV